MLVTARRALTSATASLPIAETFCRSCRQHTPERLVAGRWIRTLPENLRFGGRLKMVRCTVCGLVYLNPRPRPDALPDIYDFEEYADSTNRNPVLMRHFHAQLQRHHPRAVRVLEIGCSAGEFLAYLEGVGFECEGNPGMEEAKSKPPKFKGRRHYGLMEDLDLGADRYDAVFLLNTLEHVADPALVIAKAHQLLKPGGVFILRHPNAAMYLSWPYRYTIELAKLGLHLALRAAGRRPSFGMLGFKNQHLFYFTAATVNRILQRSGFSIREQSTNDPYNRLVRLPDLVRRRSPLALIAALRVGLGRFGLGPELLTVAAKET